MLVNAIVDNFLSFESRTELTMIPSNKTRMIPEHKVSVKGTSLLKYAAIYGANASGKSNLIHLFRFMQYCVKTAVPMEAAAQFCKNKKENISRPSFFELQFTVNDRFYAYGFTLMMKDRTVESEWLYELFQDGTYKALFERNKGEKPTIGADVKLSAAEEMRLSTYIEDFDESSSTLFLTTMNRGKRYAKDSKLRFFSDVYGWITNSLTIIAPDTALKSFEYYYDSVSLALINKLIKIFDTGITDVSMVPSSLEAMRQQLPAFVFDEVMKALKSKAESDNGSGVNMSVRYGGGFYNITSERGEELKVTTLSLKHGKSHYEFKYGEESDGTRRLFDLLDMLLDKSENTVYIVDEIERSLHPRLTSEFIKLFDRIHANQRVQLIFSTHESSIMDSNLFRRDEFWFVERDYENNSVIYSLDKFKERYDKKLSKAYLEGRYGAIPVFLSFNSLEG